MVRETFGGFMLLDRAMGGGVSCICASNFEFESQTNLFDQVFWLEEHVQCRVAGGPKGQGPLQPCS